MKPSVILLAGLFAIITAEFSFAQNTPTPTATVEPDPIKSFKELVTRLPPRSTAKSDKDFHTDVIDVTFDVKKTDSLISPVIGIINFTAKTTTPNSPDLQKKYRFGPTHTIYDEMEMVFHWQGDHWKFERLYRKKNGVDLSRPEDWVGAMSDFLKSLQ